MKKKLTTLFLTLIACAGTTFASDTAVDGIWYNFDDYYRTAEVTYRGNSEYTFLDEYSGEVVIPASVTHFETTYTVTGIGLRAFAGCQELTAVTIPNTAKHIGNGAFSDCSGLTSVLIPNSVTDIEEGAFRGCRSLSSVTIPSSVTFLAYNAFRYCSALISLDVAEDNPNYSSEDGVLFNKDKTTLVAYLSGKQGAYTIPNSVTRIGGAAFLGCSELSAVTIPGSVTDIESRAFYECAGLNYVINYATTPQEIDSDVFGEDQWSPGMDKSACTLYVPRESVELYQAAEGWNEFGEIVGVDAPGEDNSLNGIWYNFDDNNLTAEVTYRGAWYDTHSGEYVGEVVIPSTVLYNAKTYTVTSIGTYAFTDCSELSSVTIPNSVTEIQESAFYNCTGLSSVTIPGSVTHIRKQAFTYCSSLTTVTIPASVIYIGYYAFKACTGLISVTNYATTPPQSAYEETFSELDLSTRTLYVPAESVEIYRAAKGWKEFGTITAITPDIPSSAPAVATDPSHSAQKLIQNGNVYILTEDKTYTITGQLYW